jgi:hypothetical protein
MGGGVKWTKLHIGDLDVLDTDRSWRQLGMLSVSTISQPTSPTHSNVLGQL